MTSMRAALEKLDVFIFLPAEREAVHAGLFVHDGEHRVGTFDYGPGYLSRSDAVAVDPVALPLTLGRRQGVTDRNGGLFGAFRDAAPDYWGRLVTARRLECSPLALSEADLLLHGGAGRVGNLDFRAGPDAPASPESLPAMTLLDDLVAAADALARGSFVARAWLDVLQQGTSMGGARPKCIVLDGDDAWLAKFPAVGDAFNQARVEHACLCLARRAGINTVETRLVTLADGRDVLLVKRFDRSRGQGGRTLRRGFVSGLTVLDMDETERTGWSYTTLAERMRELPVAADDLAGLYRRMLYNIACRNTDDHPRNHGFLIGANGCMRLSPAYDIVPGAAMAGVGTEFRLAMAVGAEGRAATPDNALSRAVAFGLSDNEAREICAQVGETVRGWRGVFLDAGVSAGDCDRLAPGFVMASALALSGSGGRRRRRAVRST